MKDIEFPEPKLDKSKVGYAVKRFRDAHHRVARLIAIGVRPHQKVAEQTGYSVTRINTLMLDPSFKELIAHYREQAYESYREAADPFVELATENMLKAERMISEQLDAADDSEEEQIPLRTLLAIRADSADRLGFGKKQTNVNVNVDFASQLEKAIARSAKADPKIVELKAVGSSSPPVGPPADRQIAPPPSSATLPFKRRA